MEPGFLVIARYDSGMGDQYELILRFSVEDGGRPSYVLKRYGAERRSLGEMFSCAMALLTAWSDFGITPANWEFAPSLSMPVLRDAAGGFDRATLEMIVEDLVRMVMRFVADACEEEHPIYRLMMSMIE